MNPRAKLKLLLPTLILLFSGAIYYTLVSSKTERERPVLSEKVWQVEAITAERQVVSPNLTLYGRAESPELLQAAAPGAGVVDRVFVRNGARVKQGDPLVTMDQRDFSAALLQAEADQRDIDSQIAELEVRQRSNQEALETELELMSIAEAEVGRLVKLKQQNLSTDTALNSARSELAQRRLAVTARRFEIDSYPARRRTLRARYDRNQAKLAEARLALERSQLHAPFDALISDVAVAAGDRVSVGQVLVSLFPLNSLEIRAHLPSNYIASVQRALADGETLFAGLLNRSDGRRFELLRLAGEAETTGIDAYFAIGDNSMQFRPGQLLTLSLQLPAEADVFPIPYQAIYGNSRIYKIVDDRLQAVEVKSIGQARDDDGSVLLLVRSEQIEAGELISATHLPNAVSGLKVKRFEP